MQRDTRPLNCESVGCDSDGQSRGRKGLQVDICTDFNDIFTIFAFLVIYLKWNGPR